MWPAPPCALTTPRERRSEPNYGRLGPEQDPHPPEGVRPLRDRDRGEGDRRDGGAHRRERDRSCAPAHGEERLLRDPLAVQGQGLARALRDPHAQAAHRHPPAHAEDGRLAPAARPPAGGREHRDQARVDVRLPPPARADDAHELRRTFVLGLACASSTGFALRPRPTRPCAPPRARRAEGEHLMPAILAKKLGMTQLFREDGRVERVTVLEAGPCPVTGIRTLDRDGYEAVQLAFGATKEKHLSKPELGHLKKAGAPPMKHLVEFRDHADEWLVGDTVTVEAFEVGQKVKISGTSKGKGFQGTIKRHNFASGPKSHGSHNVRAPGSIGASAWPARVMKGIRGPGQMGNERVTQKGLEIVEVRPRDNLLMVRGAVPGPKNGIVEVRTDG